MKNVGLILVVVLSAIVFYALTGDPGSAIGVLVVGLGAYLVSVRPSLGGPLLYAFIGFFVGFVLAIVLGVTLFKNSKIGSDALISLLVIGPVIAILLGRRSNYRLWLSLRP